MIELENHLPDVRLRPYIKMYFWGRDATPPPSQRIVANGEMGLFFFRDGKTSLDGTRGMHACVMGQSVHYHDIVSHGGIEIVGVHFSVLGARIMLGRPLRDFFDATIELSDTDDSWLKELEKQVLQPLTHNQCWRLFDQYFLNRLAITDVEPLSIKRLRHVLAYGQQQDYQVRVDDLASEACLCARQFRRVFSDIVGIAPKDYLRVMRYHLAVRQLKRHHSTKPLYDIARSAGYYDMSHLTTDFLKISGCSPKDLLERSASDHDTFGWRL